MNKQHQFRAFAEHREECKQRDGNTGLLRQRLVRPGFQESLPSARILPQHQPAADVEHQDGRAQDDTGLHQVAVGAVVEDLEQPSREDARKDCRAGASVERGEPPRSTRLLEVGGECRDHQQGFKTLAEQDRRRLDKCAGHEQTPLFVIAPPNVPL